MGVSRYLRSYQMLWSSRNERPSELGSERVQRRIRRYGAWSSASSARFRPLG